MSWIDRLIDASMRLLSGDGPMSGLRNGALEELHHIRIERRKRRWAPLSKLARPGSGFETDFLSAVFSMLAKMAKAAGRVSDRELDAINDVMDQQLRLKPQQKALAMQILRKARAGDSPFETHAARYRELVEGDRELLKDMLDGLLSVAYAGGAAKASQERIVRLAAACFGLDEGVLAPMTGRHVEMARLRAELDDFRRGRTKAEARRVEQAARDSLGGFGADSARVGARKDGKAESALDRAYGILGCERGDPKQAVKERYRKLALGHHPDRLRAKGLSDQELRAYERHFREIHEAYEMIKRERGWR